MKSIGVLSIALISGFNFACSGASANSLMGDDDTRIDGVRAALVRPTAIVSAETAEALRVDWQAWLRVEAAFDSLLFVGTESAKTCLDGSQDAGAYDLSCVTQGHVRGEMTFESHGSTTDAGFEGKVEVKLKDACVADACVNADAVIEVIPGDCAALATLAVAATVTRGGTSESFSFGAQGGMGRGTLMARVAYFDASGASLIVDGEGGPDGAGPYLVSGVNGSFECSLEADGGRCDGATSFAFQ